MKLTKRLIAIIVLATFLVVSVAVYYFGQENVVCYYVCINPVYGNKTREAVTLYVPIVLTKDGKIHKVMKNLEVYNASKVEIVDTKYGKALKVVTSNYTVIRGYYAHRTKILSEFDPIKPSLSYDYHVYIYLNSKADHVNLSLLMCSESIFILEGGYGWFLGGHISKSVTLKNGWNVYDFPKGYDHISYCKWVFR